MKKREKTIKKIVNQMHKYIIGQRCYIIPRDFPGVAKDIYDALFPIKKRSNKSVSKKKSNKIA